MSDYDEFGLPPIGDEDQNNCNHNKKTGFGQLIDDLPNPQKHRLIVQEQNGPMIIDASTDNIANAEGVDNNPLS